MGVIDRARVGVVIDSAYGYLSSVEKFYIGKFSDDSEFGLDGSYVIESGKLGEYDIAFSGNVPIAGRLTYKNNDFVNGIIQYDDYYVLMYGGRVKVIGVPKNNSDGLYASSLEMDKGRYLYRGKNPNNYIWLDENGDGKRVDNELYRIISYEVDGTIKVVRYSNIGFMPFDSSKSGIYNMPWNNSISIDIMPRYYSNSNRNNSFCYFDSGDVGCNAWGTQNNTYYNGKTVGESFNGFKYLQYLDNGEDTQLTYGRNYGTVVEEASLNVILNDYWLKNNYLSNYIVNHDFYVGGIAYDRGYTGGDKGLKKEKEEEQLYTWNGKVGLINITDSVESSLNSDCTSVWNNYIFNKNNKGTFYSCSYNNWIQKDTNSNMWTITPNPMNIPYGNSQVWLLTTNVRSFHDFAYHSFGVNPSFFLRSDLMFDGEGTIDKPFMIESF